MAVQTPTNLTPTDGAVDVILNPGLTSDAFVDIDLSLFSLPDAKWLGLLNATGLSNQFPVNTLEKAHVVDLGATKQVLPEMWNEVWDAAAIDPGAPNERAFKWLGTLGKTQGTLTDRWFSYWVGLL